MKKIFIPAAVAIIFAGCKTSEKNTKDLTLKTAVDSVSYAIGINMGESLQQQGMPELNTDILSTAVHQAFSDDTTALMDNQKAIAYLNSYFQRKQKEEGEKNLEAGKKFLEENAKKPGVKTTASGLQYEIIKEGTGPMPVTTDKVQVNYTGSLIDGTVFDSSIDKGKPVIRPVTGFIKGWSEALQMMKEGSKWKLYVPAELGYGANGGGKIPPNSVLVFELELLKVNPPEPANPNQNQAPKNK